jgi:exodeoxyribonuclease VII small subunit
MTKKPKLPDLEGTLQEINSLISQMEQGEISLEKSLIYFERGVQLINHAQKILKTAEQKVQILLENKGEQKLTDIESPEE